MYHNDSIIMYHNSIQLYHNGIDPLNVYDFPQNSKTLLFWLKENFLEKNPALPVLIVYGSLTSFKISEKTEPIPRKVVMFFHIRVHFRKQISSSLACVKMKKKCKTMAWTDPPLALIMKLFINLNYTLYFFSSIEMVDTLL